MYKICKINVTLLGRFYPFPQQQRIFLNVVVCEVSLFLMSVVDGSCSKDK